MASSASRALADLLSHIDAGDLTSNVAMDLQREGGPEVLHQGLAYAMGSQRTAPVLLLAHECVVRLEAPPGPDKTDGEELPAPPTEELLRLASQGDWATVAYFLAADTDTLDDRLRAIDASVQNRFRGAAGGVQAQLPKDMRVAFAKKGSSSGGNSLPRDIFVEQPRWLNPRPRKDDCFLTSDGGKLAEGWYSIVQYPVGDDLREAVLRRKDWRDSARNEAVNLIRTAGETLLCKAAKAEQWELLEWMVQQAEDGGQLAQQLDTEFLNVWDHVECKAALRSHFELEQLCAALDDKGRLQRPFMRARMPEIPTGSKLLAPRLETLREALSLEEGLALEALRLVGGAVVAFQLPQRPQVRKQWFADLAALGEETLALPLLHRAVQARRMELLQQLLDASVDTEVQDARGLTALAVAAIAGSWEAVAKLLEAGCSAEGRSGALALSAAQRAARSGLEDDQEQAATLMDAINERRERSPARTLTDYFLRQVRGEMVHGIEPRRFEVCDGELQHRKRASLKVWLRAVILDAAAEHHEVFFALLASEEYAATMDAEVLDLAGKRLLREELLMQEDASALAVPVALPPACVVPDGPQRARARRSGGRAGGHTAFALALPLLARAPAQGKLLVESMTACCCTPIGRLDVLIGGIRVGSTPVVFGDDSARLSLSVPPRELEVTLEFSGRCVRNEKVVGDPEAELSVEVALAIYVYIQMVDEEEQLEFVYVCGHRRDLPEDSKPFLGTADWGEGHARLTGVQRIELGGSSSSCLEPLQNLVLKPDLQPGRAWEATEWEDTGACQFHRMLGVPVRVGKICHA